MAKIRKRSRSTSDYGSRRMSNSELPNHILESIFRRLPLNDLARTKVLSAYLNSFAESIVSERFLQAPWLMLPSEGHTYSCCFVNMEGNMRYGLHQTTSDEFLKFPCIGSSHGWLIFLDIATFTPILLNPLAELSVQIQLPSLKAFFGILYIRKYIRTGEHVALCQYGDRVSWVYTSTENIRPSSIAKAILRAEPVGDYGVVLLSNKGRLGYYRNGDSSWTKLNGAEEEITLIMPAYHDIICHKNKLYALHWDNNGSIDTWDLQSCEPGARIQITTAFPEEYIKTAELHEDEGWCTLRSYLVESEGEILLAVRFTNEGEAEDYSVYRTELFQVYKSDLVGDKWVEVKSLGDRSLFLGGNHSFSVSTKNLVNCKGNSIYFTDDYWLRMLEESSYGHDNGLYSLEDGSCSLVYEFDSESIRPLPCWIAPNSGEQNT